MAAIKHWLLLSPQPHDAPGADGSAAPRLDRLADALAGVLPRSLWVRPATAQASTRAVRELSAAAGMAAFLGDDAAHRAHVLLAATGDAGQVAGAWDVVIVVDAGSPERPAASDDGTEAPADDSPARLLITPGASAATWKRALRRVVPEARLRAAVVRTLEEFRRREFAMPIEAHVKYWFAVGGEHVFGGGQARLLEEIQRRGTLRDAARALRMSYRHAWGMIRKAEQRLGYALIVREHGGAGGGGSALTEQALALLRSYRELGREAEALARRCRPAGPPGCRGRAEQTRSD